MLEQNHECYVSLEVAKLLKEAGFDWEVNHSYPNVSALDNSCSGYMEDLSFYHNLNDGKYGGLSVPTLDIAQRWLRENKDFDINVLTDFDSVKKLYYVRYVVKDGHYKTYYISNNRSYVYFNTYEEAQEAGIKKALEMILKK